LVCPSNNGPKSVGSKAKCWLFFSSASLISLIGVPDFTFM
jgi:hypothetical protein